MTDSFNTMFNNRNRIIDNRNMLEMERYYLARIEVLHRRLRELQVQVDQLDQLDQLRRVHENSTRPQPN